MDGIKDLLVASGVRQKDLAEKMGMKASQMSLYFNGKSEMRADRFVELLEILGVDVEASIQNKLSELDHKNIPSQCGTSHMLIKLDRVRGTARKSLKDLIELLGA